MYVPVLWLGLTNLGCGFCKNVQPIFERLATVLNSSVTFANYDVSKSGLHLPNITTEGFPLLALFNEATSSVFSNLPTYEGLLAFIQQRINNESAKG